MGGMAVTSDAAVAVRLRRFKRNASGRPPRWLRATCSKFCCITSSASSGCTITHPLYMWLRQRRWTQISPNPTSDEEQQGFVPPHYQMRLSNAQAAIALRQLRRLEANMSHRRTIGRFYDERLSALGVHTVRVPDGAEPAFPRHPVWADDREAVQAAARDTVVLGEWFTSVLEESTSPERLGYGLGSCPVAEEAIQHLVNLPTHPRVRREDAARIIAALTPALSDGRRRIPATTELDKRILGLSHLPGLPRFSRSTNGQTAH